MAPRRSWSAPRRVCVVCAPFARAVRLDACVLRSGLTRDPDDYDRHIGRLTALDAYEHAGVAPADVDVAEVHDAAAIAEIIQVENLGLAPRGEGGRLALSGAHVAWRAHGR